MLNICSDICFVFEGSRKGKVKNNQCRENKWTISLPENAFAAYDKKDDKQTYNAKGHSMKFPVKVHYLTYFNLLLGMLISLSGLSRLLSTNETDSSVQSGVQAIFGLFTGLGIALFVTGCLLIVRRRLGLQFAGVLYFIIIVLVCLPKLYGLVASSQLTDEQLYEAHFSSSEVLGIILLIFLIYCVYRFLQPSSAIQ